VRPSVIICLLRVKLRYVYNDDHESTIKRHKTKKNHALLAYTVNVQTVLPYVSHINLFILPAGIDKLEME